MSLILFAKIYEAKSLAVPFTGYKNTVGLYTAADARREVRLLIKNISCNRYEIAWNRFLRQSNRKLVEKIRAKRRKRQNAFDCIIPTNRRIVSLQSKTGFFLEILPNGKVGGHINKTTYSKYLFIAVNLNLLKHIS